MKSLTQKVFACLHRPPPPVFHRTKCYALHYLSLLSSFSSRQITCTTRHSYRFVCYLFSFFSHVACTHITLPTPHPTTASSHVCCTHVVCNRRFAKTQKRADVHAPRLEVAGYPMSYSSKSFNPARTSHTYEQLSNSVTRTPAE